MPTDIVLNQIQVIERCMKRIQEEYDNNPDNFNNLTKQDSIILNTQRACEACIKLAMQIIAEKELGVPESSREAFQVLADHGYIDDKLSHRLQTMVGFHNIAVQDHQLLNLKVVQAIIKQHLDDFKAFSACILTLD